MGIRSLLSGVAPALFLVAACGGHSKKAVEKPVDDKPVATVTPPPPPPETEADREKKRHDAAVALLPPNACLPPSLKDAGAPHLELAAVAGDAILCAIDSDKSRLLGAAACWKVDLRAHTLTYQDPTPLPGRGFDVKIDDRCARGFCLPSDAKLPGDHVAHIAWNLDGTKVALAVGDDVHVFDAATKVQANTFTIRGDKNGVSGDVTAVDFVSDEIFVEAGDANGTGVWVYKADGTAVGPITAIGAKESAAPIPTHGGSFSILDKNRVAIAEQGYSQVTTYEIDSGKRTRAVRKPRTLPCKPAELEAYWKDGDKVTDKCRDAITAEIGPFIGADAIAGKTNDLVVLRGARVGELAVVDPRSLIEDKAKLIKLPWCDAAGAAAPAAPTK
jgi:hypothetical protein